MAEYIDRVAFLVEQRLLYCDNCARRKNGKGKFVYDIGDAPCRTCDICDVLDAVEDAPAADVIERKKGKWIGGELGHCSCCGNEGCFSDIWPDGQERYCPNCGADMR